MTPPDILLKARGVFKQYSGGVALHQIDFDLHRHAVNVLIGENGAGKSTLMRILSGVEQADAGSILIEDAPISLRSPRDAAAHGIAIVHQELSVMPNLDLSENVFAGRELTRAAMVDRTRQDMRTESALMRLHKMMAARTPASQLSLGSRQIIELARALTHRARILILDEPTSALSVTETESLFEVIAELKHAGVSIVYISHRLHELMRLGDYFTLLRSGRVVGQAPRSQVTRRWIVEGISGRAETTAFAEPSSPSQEPTLTVAKLSLPPAAGDQVPQAALNEVSFTLHHGEILGIYALLGAGRTELLETIAGCRRATSGSLHTATLSKLPNSVSQAMAAGIMLVPEDRQRDGLIPEMSIRENIAISCPSGPVLSRRQETLRVRELVTDLAIAVKDLDLPVMALSGGNQQKVLLARCLMRSPKILLLDEPTRGVDVGAKSEIYRVLRQLAARGLSILFTSSEIEETRILANRVLVLCQGRVSAEFSRAEMTDGALFAAASPPAVPTSAPQVTLTGFTS